MYLKRHPLKNLLIHRLFASNIFLIQPDFKPQRSYQTPLSPSFYPNFAAQTSPMYTHIPLSISLGQMVTNKCRNKHCLTNDRTKYGPNMPSIIFWGGWGAFGLFDFLLFPMSN
jgi:hypothetical protein